jgi:hypothetical protein
MDRTTNQIEAHIQQTRGDLTSNFQELEDRMKSVVDWKQHYQKNPTPLLVASFGGGMVLAMMFGRGNTNKYSSAPQPGVRRGNTGVDAWDNIKNALIGVAVTRFTDFLGEIIPGFQKQFERSWGNSGSTHTKSH